MQWILRRWNLYAIGRNATELSALLPFRRQLTPVTPRFLSSHSARTKEASDASSSSSSPSSPSLPPDTSSLKSLAKGNKKHRAVAHSEGSSRPRSRALATDVDDGTSNYEREQWQIQKKALKEKFGNEAWNPQKRLSPDTIEGIRTMHASDPARFTTPVLSENFKVSPEAIRRILKSKWQPTAEQSEKRRERWERRGERVWSSLAEVGVKPPKPWRVRGVGRAEAGEMPAWKGGGDKRRARLKDATTVRRDLVAERAAPAGSSARPGIVTPGKTMSDRIL